MKQRNAFVFAAIPTALFIFACGGGAVATTVPQSNQPAATEASFVATEAPVAATEAPTATEAPAYVQYNDADGYLSVEVPGSWQQQTDNSTKNISSELFGSPNNDAVIQIIIYDDGHTYSQSDAGQVALILLNNGYTDGAGDIKISKDQPQSDRSEDLTWSSKKSQYAGTTVFKSSGKKLIFFSVIYKNESKDTYAETFDYVLNSLQFTK